MLGRWRPTTWILVGFNVLMVAWFLLGTGEFCRHRRVRRNSHRVDELV